VEDLEEMLKIFSGFGEGVKKGNSMIGRRKKKFSD